MLRQSVTLLLGVGASLLVLTYSASARENTKASKASQSTPPIEDTCPPPSQALEGVWSPDRLLLLNPCQTITGKIDASKLPQYLADDGDVHNQFAPDKQYRKLLTDQRFIPSTGFAWRAAPVIQAGPSLGVPLEKAPVTQENSASPRPANFAVATKAKYQPMSK